MLPGTLTHVPVICQLAAGPQELVTLALACRRLGTSFAIFFTCATWPLCCFAPSPTELLLTKYLLRSRNQTPVHSHPLDCYEHSLEVTQRGKNIQEMQFSCLLDFPPKRLFSFSLSFLTICLGRKTSRASFSAQCRLGVWSQKAHLHACRRRRV